MGNEVPHVWVDNFGRQLSDANFEGDALRTMLTQPVEMKQTGESATREQEISKQLEILNNLLKKLLGEDIAKQTEKLADAVNDAAKQAEEEVEKTEKLTEAVEESTKAQKTFKQKIDPVVKAGQVLASQTGQVLKEFGGGFKDVAWQFIDVLKRNVTDAGRRRLLYGSELKNMATAFADRMREAKEHILAAGTLAGTEWRAAAKAVDEAAKALKEGAEEEAKRAGTAPMTFAGPAVTPPGTPPPGTPGAPGGPAPPPGGRRRVGSLSDLCDCICDCIKELPKLMGGAATKAATDAATDAAKKKTPKEEEDEELNLAIKDFLPIGRNFMYRIARAGESLLENQKPTLGVLEQLQFEAGELPGKLVGGFSKILGVMVSKAGRWIGAGITNIGKSVKDLLRGNSQFFRHIWNIPKQWKAIRDTFKEGLGAVKRTIEYYGEVRKQLGKRAAAGAVLGDLIGKPFEMMGKMIPKVAAGLGKVIPQIGQGVGELLGIAATFLVRPAIEELRYFQDLRQTMFMVSGETSKNVELFQELGDLTQAVAETGQSITMIQRSYIKNVRRGMRDLKNVNKITNIALNTATMIGAGAEETNEIFADWHQHLRLNANDLAVMGRNMQRITRETGLVGENLVKVMKTSEKFMMNMRNAGTFTTRAGKNMAAMFAEAQKTGTTEGMQQLMTALTGGFLTGEGPEGMRLLVAQATRGRQDLVNAVLAGTAATDRRTLRELGRNMEGIMRQFTGGRRISEMTMFERGIASQIIQNLYGVGLNELNLIIENINESTKTFAQRMDDLNNEAYLAEKGLSATAAVEQKRQLVSGQGLEYLTQYNRYLREAQERGLRGQDATTAAMQQFRARTQGLNEDLQRMQIEPMSPELMRDIFGRVRETFEQRIQALDVSPGRQQEMLTDFQRDIAEAGEDSQKRLNVLNQWQREIANINRANADPISRIDQKVKSMESMMRKWFGERIVEFAPILDDLVNKVEQALIDFQKSEFFKALMRGDWDTVMSEGWKGVEAGLKVMWDAGIEVLKMALKAGFNLVVRELAKTGQAILDLVNNGVLPSLWDIGKILTGMAVGFGIWNQVKAVTGIGAAGRAAAGTHWVAAGMSQAGRGGAAAAGGRGIMGRLGGVRAAVATGTLAFLTLEIVQRANDINRQFEGFGRTAEGFKGQQEQIAKRIEETNRVYRDINNLSEDQLQQIIAQKGTVAEARKNLEATRDWFGQQYSNVLGAISDNYNEARHQANRTLDDAINEQRNQQAMIARAEAQLQALRDPGRSEEELRTAQTRLRATIARQEELKAKIAAKQKEIDEIGGLDALIVGLADIGIGKSFVKEDLETEKFQLGQQLSRVIEEGVELGNELNRHNRALHAARVKSTMEMLKLPNTLKPVVEDAVSQFGIITTPFRRSAQETTTATLKLEELSKIVSRTTGTTVNLQERLEQLAVRSRAAGGIQRTFDRHFVAKRQEMLNQLGKMDQVQMNVIKQLIDKELRAKDLSRTTAKLEDVTEILKTKNVAELMTIFNVLNRQFDRNLSTEKKKNEELLKSIDALKKFSDGAIKYREILQEERLAWLRQAGTVPLDRRTGRRRAFMERALADPTAGETAEQTFIRQWQGLTKEQQETLGIQFREQLEGYEQLGQRLWTYGKDKAEQYVRANAANLNENIVKEMFKVYGFTLGPQLAAMLKEKGLADLPKRIEIQQQPSARTRTQPSPRRAIGSENVIESGLAYIHKGEAIIPADSMRGMQDAGAFPVPHGITPEASLVTVVDRLATATQNLATVQPRLPGVSQEAEDEIRKRQIGEQGQTTEVGGPELDSIEQNSETTANRMGAMLNVMGDIRRLLSRRVRRRRGYSDTGEDIADEALPPEYLGTEWPDSRHYESADIDLHLTDFA